MAGSSRGATKRLMTELQSYQKDPNAELLDLGPVDEEDVMHWRAVMKGVDGTAYEGTSIESPPFLHRHQRILKHPLNTPLTSPRRHMAPRHPHPSLLPQLAAHHPLHHAHLPPQRRLQDGRDLPRPAQDKLDARIHHRDDHDERTPAVDQC